MRTTIVVFITFMYFGERMKKSLNLLGRRLLNCDLRLGFLSPDSHLEVVKGRKATDIMKEDLPVLRQTDSPSRTSSFCRCIHYRMSSTRLSVCVFLFLDPRNQRKGERRRRFCEHDVQHVCLIVFSLPF